MRAAIYARRSTSHQDASLETQLTEAKIYISAKGWTIGESSIFIDDAISRSEYVKRPSLARMLNAAEAKAFDVLVIRDVDRLGGDVNRNGLLLSDLIDGGIRIDEYFHGTSVKLDNATARFFSSVKNFAADIEREKVTQRTHEALLQKARKGLNVGGRCYGYDNIEIKDDSGKRIRVEYKVNEEQAAVIREIFESYANRKGLKTVAKALNARGVASPRTGIGSWAPSAIHSMLDRRRYLGQIEWGASKKGYKGGTKVRGERPEHEWIRVDAPELRIISDELWDRAQAARTHKTRDLGRVKNGGPPAKHMMSGFGRCGVCLGRIQVINGKASNEAIKVYICAAYREKGTCTNSLRRPVPTIDAAIIEKVVMAAIDEDRILSILAEFRRRLAHGIATSSTQLPILEARIVKLQAEVKRLVLAVASSDAPPEALVQAIAERQQQIAECSGEMRGLKMASGTMDLEARRMEKDARKWISDVRQVFAEDPEGARQVLGTLLVGPINFDPIETADGPRYRLTGKVSLEKVLDGVVGAVSGASPAGYPRYCSGVDWEAVA